MRRLVAIGVVAGMLVALPALAQYQGGGNTLGDVLQGVGRSLNGQDSPPPGGRQRVYQETYNDSVRQFQSESDEQLQRDSWRLRNAWNRLHAASEALDQEMNRRGMRTGYND
jgi:hypothetical protein